MTQTLIEQLEALPRYNREMIVWVSDKELRAIIEQHKAGKQKPGGLAVKMVHQEGWEYWDEPSGKSYDSEHVAALSLKNTELSNRICVLEDLLSSAYNIANRNGVDTHWFRFASQLHINGISPVTAKTFKILPSDHEYTTPQPDIVTELVKALEDDAYAASFQSMGGYRTALIAKIKGVVG